MLCRQNNEFNKSDSLFYYVNYRIILSFVLKFYEKYTDFIVIDL